MSLFPSLKVFLEFFYYLKVKAKLKIKTLILNKKLKQN